jgi:hypothetical protein
VIGFFVSVRFRLAALLRQARRWRRIKRGLSRLHRQRAAGKLVVGGAALALVVEFAMAPVYVAALET